MLSIAICEDEPHTLVELEEKANGFLKDRGLPYGISVFTSGEQLLLSKNDYDVVLMDIQLSGISGMKTAQALRGKGKTCAIIFITSSREDVFMAFDVDAVHFLVKPVSDEMFIRALDKAIHRIQVQRTGWLTISKSQSVRKIPFHDIIYCEAVNHQVSFCLQNGKKEVHYFKIADVLGMLDERFYHCHRSYIINLSYVASLENDAVRMSNGDSVLVSRRNRKNLSQHLLTFIRREMLE